MYKNVLEFIVNLTENVTKCEENKVLLNDYQQFEPYGLFSRIDRDDKKYVTKDDLIFFLSENNINMDEKRNTVDLFIEYYDRDFDQHLNFTEFLNFVLNKDQNLIRSIATQRQTYKITKNQYLDRDLEQLAANLLMSEFYLFEFANVKKLEIFKGENQINLLDLFIDIDLDRDGLISTEDLSGFLAKRKIKICNDEIMSFISLFDEDLDSFLNWNEFLFMILPSPSTYEYDLRQLKLLEGKYHDFYDKTSYEQRLNFNSNSPSSNTSRSNNLLGKSNPNQSFLMGSLSSNNIQFSKRDFKGFVNILYRIIDFENQIEQLRNQLINNQNFNLPNLFCIFDKYNNNYISFMDFSDALESLDILTKNAILLFSKYDSNSKGRLSQEDFYNIFLPQNKENILPANEEKIIQENLDIEDIEPSIKGSIVELINSLIEYCSFLADLPKWFDKNQEEIFLCYDLIDKDKKGYLGEEEFSSIFDNKIQVSDLLLIMEKIDSDKDGKITLEDLVNLFK